MAKKKSSCWNAHKRKQQYRSVIQACKVVDETELPLVNLISDIYSLNIPRWRELTKVQKVAVFSKYIVDGNWVAVTLRFSEDFMNNGTRRPKLTDFIRRRLNENFKNRLGYVPEYMFCLEFKNNAFHIHGVIKSGDYLDVIKRVLKTTAFGRNYTKNPMPEYCKVRCKQIDDSYGWGTYILKNCNKPWFDIYMSSPVRGRIRKKYADLRCKRRLIKLRSKEQKNRI